MGNASSSSTTRLGGKVTLNDYQLPTYAPASVAERQPQDLFEDRVEAMFRTFLAQVQQRYASMYPNTPDAAVDWAFDAPLSAVPRALTEATVECFRGATLIDLANLFGVPLNAQLLPDSRSLGVVRRNVTALHPDHRRARSADLYEAATVALTQLSQLIMTQAAMFEGLTERDTTYHLDDRVLPASLLPPPHPPPVGADGGMMEVEAAAQTSEEEQQQGQQQQQPITPEEREAIRLVMRPVWGEHYSPTEEELQAVKAHLRAGNQLSLPPAATTADSDSFAVPGYDLAARESALAMRDPAEIAASGMAQTPGQGAITSEALILPANVPQPRFFQGNRIADRTLTFAGDRGGGSSWGLTLSGGSDLIGTPLAMAFRPRVAADLTDILPLRPDDNSDVVEKLDQTVAYYNKPLELSTTRLMPTMIINGVHNEARGDLAAARAKGIASLRPGAGAGGVKRNPGATPTAAVATEYSTNEPSRRRRTADDMDDDDAEEVVVEVYERGDDEDGRQHNKR